MSDLNKPRQLSLPLDYFKGRSRVARWKRRLGWGALALSVAGVFASGVFTKEMHLGASPGRVSSPHLAWDATCSACHAPFEAVSSHAWLPPGMTHASGQACRACHAGPAHHPHQTPELNCAACHREHQGIDHSLVKLDDASCTQCHRSLSDHVTSSPPLEGGAGGGGVRFENVSLFAPGSHPDFRSIKKDPGRLKFNHALHMTPGMALRTEAGLGGAAFTLEKIPIDYRDRYARMQKDRGADALVQLDCRSCHQLDARDFGLSPAQTAEVGPAVMDPRTVGAAFLPITYENQCNACHPLNVTQTLPGGDLKPLAVPHRKQPQDLDLWLENHFTAQAARGLAGFWEKKLTRPLPGKKTAEPLAPDVKTWVRENVERAARELYQVPLKKNCALCHEMDVVVAEAEDKKGEAIKHWFVASASVPSEWFAHAKFDHMAHRAVDCRECHGKAYPLNADGSPQAGASITNKDVLIPGMDNCVQCHAPASSKAGAPVGGVRFDCVLCHQYHHREQPFAGRGARARGVESPRRIEEFLKGVLKP